MTFQVQFNLYGFAFLLLLIGSIPFLVGLLIQRTREKKELITEVEKLQSRADSPTQPSPQQESYEHFMRQLSHQTTNSLQAILGAVTNLEESNHYTSANNQGLCLPKEVEYVSQIRAETRQLLELTHNLRLLAELESENAPISMRSVRLRGIVADIMMEYTDRAGEQGIDLVYHGPERPPQVLLNRDQIKQALINLVENSLKYARAESQQIILSITSQHNAVQLAVSDDGAGIPKSLLSLLADSAYRVPDARHHAQSGSGLGLAIVKRIVEQHGGELQIESHFGEGTTISIILPLTAPVDLS
ncbi:MAG: HAMP domain-containing sensor histidine kinase [Chloroflexota bacterium]